MPGLRSLKIAQKYQDCKSCLKNLPVGTRAWTTADGTTYCSPGCAMATEAVRQIPSPHRDNPITASEAARKVIVALRREAIEAGDHSTVRACDAALAGDRKAMDKVQRVLDDGRVRDNPIVTAARAKFPVKCSVCKNIIPAFEERVWNGEHGGAAIYRHTHDCLSGKRAAPIAPPPPRPPKPPQPPKTWPATYAERCPKCGLMVEKGSMAYWDGIDQSPTIHPACVDKPWPTTSTNIPPVAIRQPVARRSPSDRGPIDVDAFMEGKRAEGQEVTPAHEAIYRFIADPAKGNLQISAVAGAGKSRTIQNAIDLIPANKSILFCCFNTAIVEELSKKLPKFVDVRNMNSLGHRAWRGYLRSRLMDEKLVYIERENKLTLLAKEICGELVEHWRIAYLVKQAKSAGIAPRNPPGVKSRPDEKLNAVLEDTDENWDDIIDHYDAQPPQKFKYADEQSSAPFGTRYEATKRSSYSKKRELVPDGELDRKEWIELARKVLTASCEKCIKLSNAVIKKEVDGVETKMEKEVYLLDHDDQVYMPILVGADFENYDVVFIDEAQDLSPLQHELVSRVVGDGRIIAVGDENQAIYGFRGAASDSMDRLKKRFDMASLPLHVTYRCARDIVAEAQEYVPHIQAHHSKPSGTVVDEQREVWEADIQPGDLVICRFKAPLVKARMDLLAKNIPAAIVGEKIGDTLVKFIQRLQPTTLKDLAKKLNKWEKEEIKRLDNKKNSEGSKANVADKASCVRILMSMIDAKTIKDLEDLIIKIFAEGQEKNRVNLSTIHKTKGLEAKRVFIINFAQMPKTTRPWMVEQEENLCYVAITRAISYLEYLYAPKEEVEDDDAMGRVSKGSESELTMTKTRKTTRKRSKS